MSEGLAEAVERMRARGVDDRAIRVFSHYYVQLEQGTTGLVAESDIEALCEVGSVERLEGTARVLLRLVRAQPGLSRAAA